MTVLALFNFKAKNEILILKIQNYLGFLKEYLLDQNFIKISV